MFTHITELTDAHGWDVIDRLTPSELIKAVADLGLASEGEPGSARSSPLPRRESPAHERQ